MNIDGNGGASANAGTENANGGQKEADGENEAIVLLDDDESEGEQDDEADEGDGEEGEGEGEAGERQRPRSRSARYRERITRLERENEELRRGTPARQAPVAAKDDDDDKDLVAPKETDYPDDYLAYQNALNEYRTRKAVREENRRLAKRNADATATADAAAALRERRAGFAARLDQVKDRIPDYEKVVKSGATLPIRDDVRDAVLESTKGPLLTYYLLKNPEVLDEINHMSPAAAARKIGNLEARLRLPQPKTSTKAPPPKPALKGGGGSAKNLDPATMSNEEYRKARAAGLL
jgi:hypothetical protein